MDNPRLENRSPNDRKEIAEAALASDCAEGVSMLLDETLRDYGFGL